MKPVPTISGYNLPQRKKRVNPESCASTLHTLNAAPEVFYFLGFALESPPLERLSSEIRLFPWDGWFPSKGRADRIFTAFLSPCRKGAQFLWPS
jgi:hypothetical protein